MTSSTRAFLALSIVCGSWLGCSVERFLADDELLYDGSEIAFTEDSDIPDPDQLRTRLQAQVQQSPTGPVGMWWYYKLKPAEDSAKGLKPWLWRTLGSEPTYYDPLQASRTEALMIDYLKDHGYFGSEVERDTVHSSRNHVVVRYSVDVLGRARIAEVEWPRGVGGTFGEFLQEVQPGEYLREGEYYTIAALAAERDRINRLGARNGFFDLSTDNIYYIVDTSAAPVEGSRLPGVGVDMRLEAGQDSLTFSTFRIGNTYIYPGFSPTAGGDTLARQDTTAVEGDVFVLRRRDAPERIEPPTIARRVGLREGELYDRQIYENTVNQLLDLGVFSYVNYTFQRRADSLPILDQYVYLTQGPSQRFGVDVEGTTQIGFVPGFNATVRYGNTNLFGGAEDFTASVSAGAGLQSEFGDVDNTVLATEYGAQTEIAIPRFIGPFARAIERQTLYIPRTVAELRYQLTDRPEFSLQRAGIRLGYRAQLNRRVSVGFYPATFSYTNLISPSDTFQRALDTSPRLEQSFASNAIPAIEADFQYTSLAALPTLSSWNVKVGLKSAGALANAVLGGWGPVGANELFGVAAAQYLRSDVDARYTKPFGGWTLATRAYGGVGVPYGNSNTIPFVDQFFAGGPNSMRGFRLRGIGPGAALPPGIEVRTEDGTIVGGEDVINFNQTGDIRLEGNVEARFPLFDPYLKGAIFVDAGNVWLYNDIGEEAPEGLFGRLTAAESFDVSTLLDQFAVSIGAGLRIDIEFLVLRFDFGAPVRKPYLVPFGQDPWDFSTLNLFDGDSRDLRFQFGIGYPF